MKKVQPKKCALWFCKRTAYSKGLCHAHYLNTRRYGVSVSPNDKDILGVIQTINDLLGYDVSTGDALGDAILADINQSNWELYRSITNYESRTK